MQGYFFLLVYITSLFPDHAYFLSLVGHRGSQLCCMVPAAQTSYPQGITTDRAGTVTTVGQRARDTLTLTGVSDHHRA